MKAKPPNLTLAGREHIASAADNVRLPTKRVATEPQQADHGPSGPRHMGNPGSYVELLREVKFGRKAVMDALWLFWCACRKGPLHSSLQARYFGLLALTVPPLPFSESKF